MIENTWSRAIIYPYKCEKGAQMYRLGVSGFVSKIKITNIPHARLYVDDVILQDILGDTVVDIAAYMQCIYKELKTHMSFPAIGQSAATSILKQCGNSRLDQSDKKLISVNNITVDALMSTSRYDRKFNSLNTTKCTLSIWNADDEEDANRSPCVEYVNYTEPIANSVNTRDIIDITEFDSVKDGRHAIAQQVFESQGICCTIL